MEARASCDSHSAGAQVGLHYMQHPPKIPRRMSEQLLGHMTGSITRPKMKGGPSLNTWITSGDYKLEHDSQPRAAAKRKLVAPFTSNTASAFCKAQNLCASYWYGPGEGSLSRNSVWNSKTLEFDTTFPAGSYEIWNGEDLASQGKNGIEQDNT